jgi:DNA repair protein RecO
MKPQVQTRGIILSRIDYGEADRIITFLTEDNGKISSLAKGVRKVKSKLAGGIELFSVSHISFLQGRGDITTLVSARLETHYGNIVTDLAKTMLGYDFLKRTNRATEAAVGAEYFYLLQNGLAGLNAEGILPELTELWFDMRLLQTAGHAPNLRSDTQRRPLEAGGHFVFSFEDMAFVPHLEGQYSAGHVKLLRLAVAAEQPSVLANVGGIGPLVPECLRLAKTMLTTYVRV